tara:strand:+ start:673 stop:1449 length:777 start_codon:yes stop_codon:yes gene_type:complete
VAEINHVLNDGKPGGLKPFRADFHVNNADELKDNVKNALSLGLPVFTQALDEPDDKRAVICGSSPSLELLRGSDVRIYAANRAQDYLIDRGIIPDYTVLFDAIDETAKVFQPHKEVVYLVASQCSPLVFDVLTGYNVRIWHGWNGNYIHDLTDQQIIYGGCSCPLRAIYLAYLNGCRDFELYGMDSSFETRQHVGNEETYRPLSIMCAGREFTTSTQLAQQAQDFTVIHQRLGDCTFVAHGDGLLPYICDILNKESNK